MQIREQGQQVQLIRSPYDSTKKRCVQKVVHTFKREKGYVSASIGDYLSDEQRDDLSHDEKELLHSWLKDRVHSYQAEERKKSIRSSFGNIINVAEAISIDGIDEESAQRIYEAMDILKSRLRRLGHMKTKPATTDNT